MSDLQHCNKHSSYYSKRSTDYYTVLLPSYLPKVPPERRSTASGWNALRLLGGVVSYP